MYGMVNRAMESLVLEQHGAATWARIKARANVALEAFVSMRSYPDAMTYDLVGAASAELGVPVAELLVAFGEYWIRFAVANGYGELIGGLGTDLPTFIRGLDAMHARLGLSFPELRPPSFRCSDAGPASMRLHYHSERAGLQPFVFGLLRGLGARFGLAVQVALEHQKGDAGPGGEVMDHDVFSVAWTPA